MSCLVSYIADWFYDISCLVLTWLCLFTQLSSIFRQAQTCKIWLSCVYYIFCLFGCAYVCSHSCFLFSDRYTPRYLVNYVNGWMYFINCMFGIDFVNLHHWMEVSIAVRPLTYSRYTNYFFDVYTSIYNIKQIQFENIICKSIHQFAYIIFVFLPLRFSQ